jgi:cob(I)alamin adenosyltransferase
MIRNFVVIFNYDASGASKVLLKIYTKTGDRGETGLIGGERITKSNPRILAYGSVDELNSNIGLGISTLAQTANLFSDIIAALVQIQNDLFVVGSDLADPKFTEIGPSSSSKNTDTNQASTPRTNQEMTLSLERAIDRLELELDPIRFFILPGGSREAAILHVCRSVARRAETSAVHLQESQRINPEVIIYLNRLSDLLFVTARAVNRRLGVADVGWRAK